MSAFKRYQEQVNALQYAIRKIEDIKESGLPKNAKEIIVEALEKLNNVEIPEPPLRKVEGDFLDPVKVKDLLEESTQYKWKVVPDKHVRENFGICYDDYPASQLVASNFGIEVKDEEVKFLSFYRNTNNRSELCMVDIICIPGHFQCNWASDRGSVGDELMPNSKFEKFIQRIR